MQISIRQNIFFIDFFIDIVVIPPSLFCDLFFAWYIRIVCTVRILYKRQFLDNPKKERAGHVEANSFYYNVLNMICSDETAHSHHWAKTHALPFLPEDWKKPAFIRISARVRPLYLRYLKYRG